ncbi:hypothetical protein ACFOOK_12065 [Micromonospora krabiensis]|uniref:Uncharacterized protein n=1 Tax=Micromonospora krabiensis TaxID=307121 RepID=A0A1C3N2L9_9ACTN|nr:hypothetical protein [Micromonospora krabiensis]SBV26830.1 hypothetical protein GA0070620_2327 [Micromonospora krabiensis]
MANYDDDWTDSQRALYDECYQAGGDWAEDPDTSSDEVQYVINLAEGDDDSIGDSEIDFGPLVDAVTQATGENATSVPATHEDPAFRGFTDGVRDATSDDVFGL